MLLTLLFYLRVKGRGSIGSAWTFVSLESGQGRVIWRSRDRQAEIMTGSLKKLERWHHHQSMEETCFSAEPVSGTNVAECFENASLSCCVWLKRRTGHELESKSSDHSVVPTGQHGQRWGKMQVYGENAGAQLCSEWSVELSVSRWPMFSFCLLGACEALPPDICTLSALTACASQLFSVAQELLIGIDVIYLQPSVSLPPWESDK